MGEVSSLVRGTTGAFNGCSDQWPLVSRALAARALMGTMELKDNTIKARRLAARDSSAAGVQTIDFAGFMRDAVIPGSSRKSVVDHFAADHGRQRLDVLDALGLASQQIVRKHGEVAQFTEFNRAFPFFVEAQVGRVDRRHAQRLLA